MTARTHGMRGTPEFIAYHSAKQRCRNPKNPRYPQYGGRGIEVRCTFEEFYAALGSRPKGASLDRIDNDGHYEPGNMRWATLSQQNTNQRKPPRNVRYIGHCAQCGTTMEVKVVNVRFCSRKCKTNWHYDNRTDAQRQRNIEWQRARRAA